MDSLASTATQSTRAESEHDDASPRLDQASSSRWRRFLHGERMGIDSGLPAKSPLYSSAASLETLQSFETEAVPEVGVALSGDGFSGGVADAPAKPYPGNAQWSSSRWRTFLVRSEPSPVDDSFCGEEDSLWDGPPDDNLVLGAEAFDNFEGCTGSVPPQWCIAWD